ncbi:uncharacterized protein TRIADDRAFT_56383 [Trichoplax adhaerens]|uniref:Dolichyl-diphosphooligosaccharide--protein glycosyltransferase subunit 1 n=1 Tax=Trichoplax adhaerens TaxID=10228 RepID=B3RXZ4_TRIAD|nr:hypothetical protein TRIADDRAFT_56383 [Trichoplax adhaerens]EDV24945.1 hypothetical protein TRIADDRAFT_56383 [Trichoplax adhaerens]|eukprot:XP_002112835.1 hypothetical protein TRIADDRAFT_56383 [Trichoplax adhaerens]
MKVQVLMENTGTNSINSFHIAIESKMHEMLSFIDANVKTDASNKHPLMPRRVSISDNRDKSFYRLQLRDNVAPSGTVAVEIEMVFVNALRPYPAQINQLDKQLVIYDGSPYFFSPYNTIKQITTVTLASSNVESYSKVKPVSLSGSTITYGPYRNTPAFDGTSVTIHYENNSPFLSVVSLERVIEVSHWGNIAVEEKIHIKHVGAALKGSFSRFDFQRGQSYENIPAVKSFKTVLPASAKDVYYRDEIGNISTSHMLQLEDSVELDIRPRFPLFGGWQTHYTLGYNVPSFQYLYSNGNSYLLQMRLIDHIFDNCVIENIKLRIILPEGAKNIIFKAPYQVERDADGLHFTYLDVVGRPVISIHKSKLVEHHIQDFNLRYDFSQILLLREPLLVVVIKDEANEARQKVAGILEEIQCLQENRESLYESFSSAISKYKAQKNSNAFGSARKKFDLDYKKIYADVTVFLEKLGTEKAESTITQQIQEIQTKEMERKHLLDQTASLTEQIVVGKIDREKYIDNLQSNMAKRSKLAEEIAILNSNL